MLKKSADITYRDKDGNTLLHHVGRNKKDTFQFLVKHGLDPKKKNNAGKLPRQAPEKQAEKALSLSKREHPFDSYILTWKG